MTGPEFGALILLLLLAAVLAAIFLVDRRRGPSAPDPFGTFFDWDDDDD